MERFNIARRLPETGNHATVASCVALFASLWIAATATAQYTFMNIADDSGHLIGFSHVPTVNADNTTTFSAYRISDGVQGIYIGADGALQAIADSRGRFSGFSPATAINARGTVAFNGYFDQGGHGLFTWRDGQTTTIAETGNRFVDVSTPPHLNLLGQVAFVGERVDGGKGIYVGDGSQLSLVVETGNRITDLTIPLINNAGDVVFNAELASGDDAVMLSRGGELTTIADTRGTFADFGAPTISDSGDVFLHTTSSTGEQSIYRYDDELRLVVDTSGEFSWIHTGPATNANGDLAFLANLRLGGRGIFTGADPEMDVVIRTGDRLFDSTVRSLHMYRGALADNGSIAFHYSLFNNVEGIAIAVIPAPGSTLLLAFGLIAVRRRRSET